MKKIVALILGMMLAGCAGDRVYDESSAFVSVPVGSALVLNQDVTIDGRQVATYVQDGVLKIYNDVDWYRPNCKFEIYTMSEQPRVVVADRFVIKRVVDEMESSSILPVTRVASLAVGGLLDRSLVYNYATMMYLQSEAQPDVYRMTCQHWEDLLDDRYLSIEQMRQAMGDVFTLDVVAR